MSTQDREAKGSKFHTVAINTHSVTYLFF